VHLSNNEIDEALWAAYRRYDKSAVTQKLLRRYLMTAAKIEGARPSRSTGWHPECQQNKSQAGEAPGSLAGSPRRIRPPADKRRELQSTNGRNE
jgi:hypothetical protein